MRFRYRQYWLLIQVTWFLDCSCHPAWRVLGPMSANTSKNLQNLTRPVNLMTKKWSIGSKPRITPTVGHYPSVRGFLIRPTVYQSDELKTPDRRIRSNIPPDSSAQGSSVHVLETVTETEDPRTEESDATVGVILIDSTVYTHLWTKNAGSEKLSLDKEFLYIEFWKDPNLQFTRFRQSKNTDDRVTPSIV